MITRMGTFRWAIWVGWAVTTVGSGLYILFDVNTRTIMWASALSIFGLGSGMVLSSLNFAIQAIVKTEDAGRAASMYAFMRSIGMTIGVAAGGTIFQNFMKAKLTEFGLPGTIAKNAEAYVSIMKTLAVDDPTRVHALQAYVHGFKGVFEVMTALSGVAFVVSLAIRHYDMDKILESKYKLAR